MKKSYTKPALIMGAMTGALCLITILLAFKVPHPIVLLCPFFAGLFLGLSLVMWVIIDDN